MERVFPLALDMVEQEKNNPTREYVLFYDDGSVFRAFLVDGVTVSEKTVEAYVQPYDGPKKVMVALPVDTTWRLVHKSCLEFVNGATMEQLELIGAKQKSDLKEKMLKKLGYDKDGKPTKKRKDSAVEGIPLKTGQYA